MRNCGRGMGGGGDGMTQCLRFWCGNCILCGAHSAGDTSNFNPLKKLLYSSFIFIATIILFFFLYLTISDYPLTLATVFMSVVPVNCFQYKSSVTVSHVLKQFISLLDIITTREWKRSTPHFVFVCPLRVYEGTLFRLWCALSTLAPTLSHINSNSQPNHSSFQPQSAGGKNSLTLIILVTLNVYSPPQ